MKLIIPWLKVFVDSDTRYEQFLCPALPDPSTISAYQPKCPYVPQGGTTPPPTSPPPPAAGPIVVANSGRCLDVPGATQSPGTQVQLWDLGGTADEQWNVNANGTTTGVQPGLCLDGNRQRRPGGAVNM